MCGRFAQTTDFFRIKTLYDFELDIEYTPHYNYSPGQEIPSLILFNNKRKLELHHWGLITDWTIEKKYNLINIRKESLFEKKTFYNLFITKRCLILADGFYEWKNVNNKKIPFFIFLKNKTPFAFAGIWYCYTLNNKEIKSCAIITTEPNSLISDIHDRMPAIITLDKWDQWLDNQNLDTVKALLNPLPSELIDIYEVSSIVNNPKNDNKLCVTPRVKNNDQLFQ